MGRAGRPRLVVAGGVSANRQLRERLANVVSERGAQVWYPRLEFCTDNGAMIAYAGLLAFREGQVTPMAETTCTQRYRTDDVLVTWRKDK